LTIPARVQMLMIKHTNSCSKNTNKKRKALDHIAAKMTNLRILS